MQCRCARWISVVLAQCLCVGAALADGPPTAGADTAASCATTGMPAGDPLLQRKEIFERLKAQPEACLKAQLSECSKEASQGLMGFGSASYCSLSYEALLATTFRGDFNALLAWWRSELAPKVAAPG